MHLQKINRLTQSLILCAIVSIFSAVSSEVSAEPGWYAGGSLGFSNYDNNRLDQDLAEKLTPGTSSLSDDGIPWHLFFGYQYNKYIGFEGGYQYLDKQQGSTTLQSQATVITETTREIDGFLFGIKGFLPVYNQYSLQLSGGFYRWHMLTAINSLSSGSAISINFNDREITPYFAIELHRTIAQQTNFFIQWLALDVDDDSAEIINVGFLHYISSDAK